MASSNRAAFAPPIRPRVSSGPDAAIDDLTKWVQTRSGTFDLLDSVVTRRDLTTLGVYDFSNTGRNPGGGTGGTTDPGGPTGPPPTPTDLVVNPTPIANLLAWNMPPYIGLANYEVWRSPTSALGNAVLVAAPTAQLYYDAVGPGQTYWYWVRSKSTNGLVSAYNSSVGTQGTTDYEVADLLEALTGQITESQLYRDLGTTIKVFAPYQSWNFTATLDGWTGYVSGVTPFFGSFVAGATAAQATSTVTGDLIVERLLAAGERFVGALAPVVRARIRRVTGTGWYGRLFYRTAAHNYSTLFYKSIPQPVFDDQGWAVVEWDMAALTLGGTDWTANEIQALRLDLQRATSTGGAQWEVDWIAVGSRSEGVGGLQVQALGNQYTIKIDVNGYVTGFGLAVTAPNGVPTSSFIVRADSFAIASPSGPGITPRVPFFVRTTPVVIDGVTIPAGVYISVAAIQDLSVTNAKITSLAADKILAGYIEAALAINGAKVYGAELFAGGTTTTTRDANGNVTGFTANNPTVRIQNGDATFDVNSFFIRDATGADTPFQVVGGNTTIKNAFVGTIQSDNFSATVGWQLSKTGPALFRSGAVFSGALSAATGSFSGSVTATSGQIGGATIDSTGVQSDNYSAVTPTTGWRLDNATGQIRAYDGVFGGALSAATGTFTGALLAATGTFSGALTAAAVNAVNTINVAGNAITVPVAASGGASCTGFIDTDGAPLYINYHASATVTGSSGSLTLTIELRENGALRDSYSQSFGAGGGGGVVSVARPVLRTSTSTALTTIALSVSVSGGGGFIVSNQETIFYAQATKR